MARIRSIKPEWLEDEKLAACSDGARLLSIGLILLADDHGRGRASTHYLSGQVWTYTSRDPRKIAANLGELSAAGFALVYEVDGQAYYEIRTWHKHQRIDNAGKPRVPPPSNDSRNSAAKRGETPLETEKETDTEEEKETEKEVAEPPSAVVEVFPCRGKPTSWPLTEARIASWTALYPGVDVLAECRKALAWVGANGGKTAGGMPAFLVRWLNRTTNRAPPNGTRAPQSKPEKTTEALVNWSPRR